MKVKELIEILQRADQDMPVVIFMDGGPEEVDNVQVYETIYMIESEEDCRTVKEL